MSSDSVMFGWMAMDHVGASVFHNVRSTYLGCRQVYASVEYILDDPLRWLDAVSRHGVTHTFSPNFAYELIVKRLREISPPAGRWALGPLTSIINGGEQVSLQGVRSFLTALAGYGLRPSAMQPGWGMSEMGGGVTHGLRLDLERHAGFHIVDRGSLAPGSPAVFVGRDHPDGVVLVEVGGPMPGATVRVVDQDLQLVPEDTIGFIQCQGRMTMPGYYQDQAATEAAFTRDGWIDTGDLGFLHEGELTITGRAKDIVIVRGRNLLCHDIEAVASVDGVEAPFVAALSAMDDESNRERLVIFFAPQEGRAPGDAAQTAGRIRAAVASKLGVEVDLALPYAADAFPRTTSGKIRRGELRRRVESGELDQLVSEATTLADAPGDATSDLRSDEERQVAALWQELLGAPVRRREDNFFELGGHSVLAVSLVRQLGERFGVHLSIGQLVECQTVATMAALVSGAGESQASKHLVAFQAKGEAAPLVCIHATGGDILYYKRLADVLGPRQPVFGLQSRALLSADEYETIDEMAQAYAEVIRAHVPGPRSLVGWSMGGVLAVAMAKIFEEWGEEVAFVGLLDSHLARVGTRPDPLMAIELAFGGSLSAAFAATPEADRRALAESLATLSPGERDRRVVEWGREKKLFTEPLDVDDLTRRIGLGVHHARCWRVIAPLASRHPSTSGGPATATSARDPIGVSSRAER
jgi:pimeloyl-ACP methyl ester carboxylesterase